jgi:Protein of unknown function (DUF3043)
VFGRRTAKKSEPETVEVPPQPGQGKGRPTPKRSEAEKARKKRMTPPRDRKQAAALQRERARAERQKRMQGMQTGDERYLPNRDRGPVRRFVRDYVDSRRCVGEVMLPGLLVILALTFIPQRWAASATSLLFLLIFVLTAIDTVLLVWRLGRELQVRFPDTSTRGAKFYAFLRSSQMRRLRMPKPQIKPGAPLPDRY